MIVIALLVTFYSSRNCFENLFYQKIFYRLTEREDLYYYDYYDGHIINNRQYILVMTNLINYFCNIDLYF